MMQTRDAPILARAARLAIAAIGLALALASPAASQEVVPIRGSRVKAVVVREPGALPAAVARTRARLLEMSERNDVKAFVAAMKKAGDAPRLSEGDYHDPAQLWADVFPEDKGAGALAEIARLLGGPALKRADGSVEWPYYATADFARLTGTQTQELTLVLGQPQFDEIKAGSYPGWRLSISAKGKWLSFLHG